MSRRESILDYSTSVWDEEKTCPAPWADEARGDSRRQALLESRRCPFCALPTKHIIEIDRLPFDYSAEGPWEMWGSVLTLHGCFRCGWWEKDSVFVEEGATAGTYTKNIAVLKQFDVSDASLPLAALRRELTRRPSVLYGINTRKFEELVASVVSDYRDCEVHLVGRTSDGGIDLVYMDGDVPTAMQVKRRESPDAAETVVLVREFLGAMLLSGFTRGAVVTTAHHFTRGAKLARAEALRRGLVLEIDLIDCSRFYGLFKSHCSVKRYPWEEQMENLLGWARENNATVRRRRRH